MKIFILTKRNCLQEARDLASLQASQCRMTSALQILYSSLNGSIDRKIVTVESILPQFGIA